MEYITKYLVEILFSFVSFLFVYLYKKVKSVISTMDSTKKSLLALTKNLFIQKYYFYKRQNSISLYEKEALTNLYAEYKKLGGNGVVENMFEEIDLIPLDRCD
ncbi:MAG: hypothetical protein MR550_00125 [Bacilli bacterium]|nr:hypothetical protein [Bacilli bacterium]